MMMSLTCLEKYAWRSVSLSPRRQVARIGFDSKISPEHKNQKNLWNCVKAKLLKHPYPSAMIPIEGDGTPKMEEEYVLTVTSV